MLRTLRTIFLVAMIAIMGYWLMAVASDVYRAGVLGMSDLRDGGGLALLIYLAVADLRRGGNKNE